MEENPRHAANLPRRQHDGYLLLKTLKKGYSMGIFSPVYRIGWDGIGWDVWMVPNVNMLIF